MSVRTDLADFLKATFPDQNLYASPPGKVEIPAIVIGPDAPYVQQTTFCLYEWSFLVGFVVGRTADSTDLNALDEIITTAYPALETVPMGSVDQVRSIDAMDIGGTPYVAAVFTVKMKGTM